MIANWDGYGGDDYLTFVEQAQPEVCQLGFYGGHFWSLVHTPAYKGYPAHFPVQGLKECGDWFAERNKQVHTRGAKVIGHFNVEFLVGDIDGEKGPTGFFKFYRDLWDEKELGPKPVADPVQLLERGKDGQPIGQKGYGIGGMHEHWACLRNPHWQTVLKAWVKRGIERGVDGYVANYFYRHDCHCEHCQKSFRDYLAQRHTPAELNAQFAIADLPKHEFSEIVYWHAPAESTPLRREMLRWSQIANKQAFDEVFIDYGRSLKPDLIVGQWNHISAFSQINGDERCLLPAEVWGKGENHLWYSTGAAACYTDLEKGDLGEGTLQARYIRGMFDNKPFTLGKYESTRIRAAISELAANGGSPMGFYARITDPLARDVFAQYFGFMKQYANLYQDARSHAEAVLVFPRTRVFAGDVEAVAQFKELGAKLLNAHVLFDIVSDEAHFAPRLAGYKKVVRTAEDADKLIAAPRSKFAAPTTVRASVDRTAGENALLVHLVNYNREEPPRGRDGKPSPGGGVKDEKAIAAVPVDCQLLLPPGAAVKRVLYMTPEKPEPTVLEHKLDGGAVKFRTGEFLVYGMAKVELEPAGN
jgi:hypothetical protein